MKIINLIEDTPGENGCLHEHGLCFYIETQRHRLLFDTGASGAFLHNADLLGIDLTAVDTVILSHGHYDHAGGMLAFAERNPRAKIYFQQTAMLPYYHVSGGRGKDIGADERIGNLAQAEAVDGNLQLDEELFLFARVKGRRLWPAGNLELKRRTENGFVQDEFEHEQYLVITQDGCKTLLSGCAHNGILNILETYRGLCGGEPDTVISGFHMAKKGEYTARETAVIEETAQRLKQLKTVFYTGHCTGTYPYETMHALMGTQLRRMHSGDRIL